MCLVGATAVLAADPIRIMVVGDSVSVGYTDNPKWTVPFEFGFRSGLYQRLTNSGMAVQFVGGSLEPWNGGARGTYGVPTNTPTLDLRKLGQDHCAAYGGRKISYVSGNIASWLSTYSPDIVLLMIGVNDIHDAPSEPAATKQSLRKIITDITTIAPNTHLIVAQITPYGVNCPGIVKYNKYIREVLVPSFAAQGKHVTTVDQYANLLVPGTTRIDGSLFANGLNHPNSSVYDRMADTWFKGIQALKLPSPATPASGK
jgi:hypothetical protein